LSTPTTCKKPTADIYRQWAVSMNITIACLMFFTCNGNGGLMIRS